MNITSFHQRFIARPPSDPLGQALQRVCGHRPQALTKAAPPAPSSLDEWDPWSPQHEVESADAAPPAVLDDWDPWGAQHQAAPSGSNSEPARA